MPGPAMPTTVKPGVVPLRPLGLGEIYDGAFQSMRRHPAAMMGSAALVVTVITVVGTVGQYLLRDSLLPLLSLDPTATPSESQVLEGLGGLGVVGLLSLVLQLVGLSLLTGILVTAVSHAVLGQRSTFGEVWRTALPRLLPLMGLTLLLVVGYLLLTLVIFAPVVAVAVASPVAGGVLLVLAFFGWIAALLWLAVRVSLATPALVLERIGVMAALRRGWSLTRGSFWRCLGILALASLIVFAAAMALSIPAGVVSMVYVATQPENVLATAGMTSVQLVISGVSSIISSAIVYPFWAGVTALLYIDLRMRREGLDVELGRAAATAAAR